MIKNNDKRYREIGENIRNAREGANISQLDLAKKIGFGSATAISLIESGERRVSVKDLEMIAGELHVDIKMLLGQSVQKTDIGYALRSDKELSTEAKKQVMDFIEFVKKKHGK